MTSIDVPMAKVAALAVPAQVEAAIRHLRSEQRRAALLVAGAAKYRWLSALYEHEARPWTLLLRHTAEPVYRRAAADAQITARTWAREYAEFAHHWTSADVDPEAAP
jgi:hypothetical protein